MRRRRGLASSTQQLIAWTCEHGHRAVCGGDLVGDLVGVFVGDLVEVEAVVEVDSKSGREAKSDGVLRVAPVNSGNTGSAGGR